MYIDPEMPGYFFLKKIREVPGAEDEEEILGRRFGGGGGGGRRSRGGGFAGRKRRRSLFNPGLLQARLQHYFNLQCNVTLQIAWNKGNELHYKNSKKILFKKLSFSF